MPGGDGAGPSASRGSTPATGGSADLGPRGKQSSATGQTLLPTTALRVVQWNAEGILQKKPELQAFLRENKVDVICIQETHLSKDRRFFVRGYEAFRRDRPSSLKGGLKGGVMTLIKHGIPAVLTAQSAEGELEFITIKLLMQDEELHISNCYSSPSTRLHLHTLQLFTEKHLITGDFNGHSPAWGYETYDSRGEEIQDWMTDNQLILINKPNDKPSYYSRAWKKNLLP